MKAKLSIKNNTEEDDDCEICKLMEKGEHRYEDLTEAFTKQNAKNELNRKETKS